MASAVLRSQPVEPGVTGSAGVHAGALRGHASIQRAREGTLLEVELTGALADSYAVVLYPELGNCADVLADLPPPEPYGPPEPPTSPADVELRGAIELGSIRVGPDGAGRFRAFLDESYLDVNALEGHGLILFEEKTRASPPSSRIDARRPAACGAIVRESAAEPSV